MYQIYPLDIRPAGLQFNKYLLTFFSLGLLRPYCTKKAQFFAPDKTSLRSRY